MGLILSQQQKCVRTLQGLLPLAASRDCRVGEWGSWGLVDVVHDMVLNDTYESVVKQQSDGYPFVGLGGGRG